MDRIWAVVWAKKTCGIMVCGMNTSEIDWSLFSALCCWLGSKHQLTNYLTASKKDSFELSFEVKEGVGRFHKLAGSELGAMKLKERWPTDFRLRLRIFKSSEGTWCLKFTERTWNVRTESHVNRPMSQVNVWLTVMTQITLYVKTILQKIDGGSGFFLACEFFFFFFENVRPFTPCLRFQF